MAQAMKLTETVTNPVVTLAMTPDEARALRTVLAHVGWSVTQPIFAALGDADIQWDEYQEFRPTKTHGCIIAVTE
jgi:hypothetical protein